MSGFAGLRGASADALAALRESAGTRTQADAATLGEQLFAVASLFRAEPSLRRAATDPSLEPDAKAGLIDAVLGDKVEAKAKALVVDAVRRRWTVPSDLASALEQLAVAAVVQSAGKADGERVGTELFEVSQTVDGSPELYGALTDPSRSPADRSALLTNLVGDRVLPATRTLIEQAVLGAASGRGNVVSVLADYQRLAAAARGEVAAVVHTARELDAADVTRLSQALGKQYSATVQLHVVVDPDLVGGLRVEIGDDVIDGTVVTRLDEARRRLAG